MFIAAHILSNFYNFKRSEYYRKLNETSKNNLDLTHFINYARQGFKDGLQKIFNIVNQNQIELAWKNYVHEIFKTSNYFGESNTVNNRRLALILFMDIENEYVLEEISETNDILQLQYLLSDV